MSQASSSVADMRHVHPLRWNEIRRRINVVEAYLKQSDQSLDCQKHYAEKLKLSVGQFRRLTRSWQIHRDAAALSGARSKPRFGIERSTGVQPQTLNAIAEGISAAGPHSKIANVTAGIEKRCAEMDIESPAPAVVWKCLMEARSKSTQPVPNATASILIGRVWFEFPYNSGSNGKLSVPECLIALQLPHRRIVTWAIAGESNRAPIVSDLFPAFSADSTIRATDLELGSGTIEAGQLNLVIDDGAQAEFIRYIGWRIGDIAVKFRQPRKNPSRLVGSTMDAPVSSEDAKLAIGYAVTTHNERLDAR